MIEEKKHTLDGFITRVIITCPRPRVFEYNELESVSSIITFEKILIAIKYTHFQNNKYTFDLEAFDIFRFEAQDHERICRNNERKNYFIG